MQRKEFVPYGLVQILVIKLGPKVGPELDRMPGVGGHWKQETPGFHPGLLVEAPSRFELEWELLQSSA